ncbi:MAG: polysaccharide biosynthesis/export family protein [Candidatus Omnitrophota bacterium]
MTKILSVFVSAVLALCLISPDLFSAERPEYRIQSSDVLSITVHGQPDLATKTRVTQDGYISFPLIGKVAAKGLTVQELEQTIKEMLEKSYLVNAAVLVFIEEYHPRQVSVIGEVKSPGKYDMPGEKNITLMQSIAMAGGFTKHAEVTRIRIMRIENGEKKTFVVNSKEITDKGDKDKDMLLEAEDIVFVPESFF